MKKCVKKCMKKCLFLNKWKSDHTFFSTHFFIHTFGVQKNFSTHLFHTLFHALFHTLFHTCFYIHDLSTCCTSLPKQKLKTNGQKTKTNPHGIHSASRQGRHSERGEQRVLTKPRTASVALGVPPHTAKNLYIYIYYILLI